MEPPLYQREAIITDEFGRRAPSGRLSFTTLGGSTKKKRQWPCALQKKSTTVQAEAMKEVKKDEDHDGDKKKENLTQEAKKHIERCSGYAYQMKCAIESVKGVEIATTRKRK
jgi:hypothetical protein